MSYTLSLSLSRTLITLITLGDFHEFYTSFHTILSFAYFVKTHINHQTQILKNFSRQNNQNQEKTLLTAELVMEYSKDLYKAMSQCRPDGE